jgi:electron transport complex protein RnfE
MSKFSVATNGIIKENPVLILLLGLCPMLAVSTLASNAVGMGAATTFVLVSSNVVISALRKIIPDKVRIPCFVVIIAGFVTIAQMLVEAYAYPLYLALGIFLPLIVVNCIVLGRAEAFANKNGVVDSFLDGIGSGIGFTLALLVMASFREIFGNGTWFDVALPVLNNNHVPILVYPPGGFVVLGLLIALVTKLTKGKVKKEIGCKGCFSAAVCGKGCVE